jgi:hypothetical protein
MKLLCQALLCLAIFTTLAMGQAARTATLVGTVTDPTGAVIPGAKLTITNTETSTASNGSTNAEGAYYIPYLAVGSYELTVEATGFKKFIQKGITLRAAEVPKVDVKLEIGAASQSVEITGATPMLETETSQVSQTIEHATVQQLPVMQMKAHRILYYLEGLQIRGANASVVGQDSAALGFTLDGVSAKTSVSDSMGDTNTAVQPTLDALAEVKVYTTGAPAEIGHASGGMLSMTFKSGTNGLHGSIEDRYTNQPLTHRGYLEQGARTNPLGFHELQSTVSGPVVIPKLYDGRNKTFFLFAYGRHDERSNEPQSGTVPDDNMLKGDFSFPKATGGGYPIYDPRSMRLVNNAWTADPFANFQVPAAQFDPVAVKFLALNPWKAANNSTPTWSRTGPSNNFAGQTIYRAFRNRFDIKLDEQISADNKFFVRMSWNRHRQIGRVTAFINNPLLDSVTPSYGRPQPIDQQSWAFGDYHTFSPTFMNEVRLGFGRRKSTTDPPTATTDVNWAKDLGIPNVGSGNFPSFGLYSIGPGGFTRTINEDVTFQDNVTKVTGHHTLKFGYEVIRTRQNNVDQVLPSGSYSFGTGGTALPFVNNTGNTFASFLLGSVSSASFTQSVWNRLPRWWSHSGYIQTDWRATKNVTLNLGLRYSLETPFRDKWDHQSQFDPKAIDAKTGLMGAIVHPTGGVYNTDTNNWQPRVGLAWNFRKNMVFRGSWGALTQDLMPSAGFQDYTATAQVQQNTGDPRPAFYLTQGPPNRSFVLNPDGTSQFLGTNYSSRGATFVDKNLHLPYVMNWSGGVQTQMGGSWVTEVIYQGSAGVGLSASTNLNQLPQSIFNSTDLTFLNAVSNATQNYRPYTQFGTISYMSNPGHNTYHGLITRVEKRLSPNGLTVNAHYTWSKNLSGTAGDGWQYYNWGLTKGPTGFDTRHRFVLQGTWDVPVGKGRKYMNSGSWLDYVVGGWNALTVFNIQSGPAATFGISGSPNKYLPGPQRPIQMLSNDQVKVANWTMGANRFPQSAQNPYYNINAFIYAPAFTNSPLGSGTTTGRWLIYPQFSLTKSYTVKERYKFTVRVEGNNIPVRFNAQTPSTTVNLSDQSTFGKFGVQGSSSYSTLGGSNGQLFIGGRFAF